MDVGDFYEGLQPQEYVEHDDTLGPAIITSDEEAKYLLTAPLSGQCSKLPRAGVILSQIIPQGMWGPEYVKFKITR